MKAIICDDYGSLENLTYKETAPPKINDPDDVIIKVESCGVNFPDGLLVQGKYQHKQKPLSFLEWKYLEKFVPLV